MNLFKNLGKYMKKIAILLLSSFFYCNSCYSIENKVQESQGVNVVSFLTLPIEMRFKIYKKLNSDLDTIIDLSNTSDQLMYELVDFVKLQKEFFSKKYGLKLQYIESDKIILDMNSFDSSQHIYQGYLEGLFKFINKLAPNALEVRLSQKSLGENILNLISSHLTGLKELGINSLAYNTSFKVLLDKLIDLEILKISGGFIRLEDIENSIAKNLRIFECNNHCTLSVRQNNLTPEACFDVFKMKFHQIEKLKILAYFSETTAYSNNLWKVMLEKDFLR